MLAFLASTALRTDEPYFNLLYTIVQDYRKTNNLLIDKTISNILIILIREMGKRANLQSNWQRKGKQDTLKEGLSIHLHRSKEKSQNY